VIQRRVIYCLRDVQQSIRRVVILDGFLLAFDEASVATFLGVDDAENVSRAGVPERDKVRDPVVGTRLTPNGVVVVVDVLVVGTGFPENGFLFRFLFCRHLFEKS
jgi:hypothetical protein